MKMRTKAEGERKISKLQKSQDENVDWWNKFTEEQKIAMGLRPAYYTPVNFKKTKEERKLLHKLRTAWKVAQAING